MMKIAYDIVSQYGKFAQKCPIEKDTRYYFDDFKVTENMIPAYVPLRNSFAIFTMSYFTLEKKRMVQMVSGKIFIKITVV